MSFMERGLQRQMNEESHCHKWSNVYAAQEVKLGAVEVSKALESASKVKKKKISQPDSTLNTTLTYGSLFILRRSEPLWAACHILLSPLIEV